MIDRVLQDERARRAARRARTCYGIASLAMMAALALFGAWRLLASLT